jgi:hypothetical protein
MIWTTFAELGKEVPDDQLDLNLFCGLRADQEQNATAQGW